MKQIVPRGLWPWPRKSPQSTVLTYDARSLADGAGAQFQRILGIYALSREIGAHYLHTPIERLGYLGTPRSESASGGEAAVLAGFERLTSIKSDPAAIALAECAEVVKLENPNRHELSRSYGTQKNPRLLQIAMPYGVVDSDPKIWRHLRTALKDPEPKRSPLRIAVHIRRGDIHFHLMERLLPNSYYLATASRLSDLLARHAIAHQFEIFSETLNSVPAGNESGKSDDAISAKDDDRDRFDEFRPLNNVSFHLDKPLLETIDRMASADVLVTSKSSLSFVAALLNPDRLVLQHPFWHQPMPHWVLTSDDGSFDESKAMSQILRR